jgi:uncharacterized membrane protein HdeD (DUF308 family)
MKHFLSTYGLLMVDLSAVLTGILFLAGRSISWIIIFILLIVLCFYEPVTNILTTRNGLRKNDGVDFALTALAFAVGIPLLLAPGRYMYSMHFLAGVWMLSSGVISAIDCYVIIRDRLNHLAYQLFYTIYASGIGLFLILGASFQMKTWILSLLAGIFFITYGLRSFLSHIRTMFPSSYLARHTTWSLSLPLLISAFVPMRAWYEVQTSGEPDHNTEQEPADLYVYVYCKGSGFERFGHIDIAYQGKNYSYGCHDPLNRTLGGTLGDGVLMVIDQKKFIANACEGENKTIIQYGLRLNETEKKTVEEKIRAMMTRTIPWQPQAQVLEQEGKDNSTAVDYASRVYKNTGASFYKFSSGKFRTYFAASTNCVLLADELIRSPQLRLVSLSGFVTPGSYLSFLEEAYETHAGKVISRVIYKS